MFKVMALIWVMLGTAVAGSLVLVVLAVPSLLDQGMRLIPLAGIGGYAIALPLSWMVARRLMASRRPVSA